MIDANARHMGLGELFFLEVHSCDVTLCNNGVISGDILLARIAERTEDHDQYTVEYWTKQDKEDCPYEYCVNMNDNDDNKYYAWLVYSGCPDGKGFISEEWKQKALDFLEGKWV